MLEDFIRLPADELLKRFGAGNHKPGSGSAAALKGMLSCSLVTTVITLTAGHPKYDDDTFAEAQVERVQEIFSRLMDYFQEDSLAWDRVIQARRARDEAQEAGDTKSAEREARNALAHQRHATELPIRMGELCLELAESALLVFDIGFKSARGDSIVAIAGALSAASGCVGIAYLNLKGFRPGKWAAQQRVETDHLDARAAELHLELERRKAVLRKAAEEAVG